MAFQSLPAMKASRHDAVLSADNAKPDRFKIMDILRRAAPALSIGPGVLATVDALLSCLPPKRKHDIVFASNETLMAKRHGITDRTLRRHFADLIKAGLMARISSPNGKRYSRRSSLEAGIFCFGLDLAPLFNSVDKLVALARAKDAEDEQDSFLRTRLRAALHRRQDNLEESTIARSARQALRRTHNLEELHQLIAALEDETPKGLVTIEIEESGSDRQNVRHHQNSEKELIEKKALAVTPISLVQTCKEAASYLVDPVTSPEDVVRHAHTLAPMLGISPQVMEAAARKKGRFGAALALWIVLELRSQVRNPIAYYKSITSGERSNRFCPVEAFRNLAAGPRIRPIRCPRTTPTSLA